MKKIILFVLIILLIPYMIVTFLVKEKYIKKEINKEIEVRVKRDNNIVSIPLEEYIIGVVSAEMPASFELEALKAQAVASRSYVLKKIDKTKEYDVVDTVMNQVYLDNDKLKEKWNDKYEEYYNKIKEAVNETSKQYLTYNGEVIDALFFSTSSGKTENVEEVFSENLPYLRSVDSSWDEISPVFNETITIPINEFYNKLNMEYNDDLNIDILEKTSTGRIKKIKINENIFEGRDFSNKLNLKSNFFTINKLKDNLLITTSGYGHGVGMSQYGAQAMALKGYKYDEILKYYYQNVEINSINNK